jgi:hypothetical protein
MLGCNKDKEEAWTRCNSCRAPPNCCEASKINEAVRAQLVFIVRNCELEMLALHKPGRNWEDNINVHLNEICC